MSQVTSTSNVAKKIGLFVLITRKKFRDVKSVLEIVVMMVHY